jgi:hypothetical protein
MTRAVRLILAAAGLAGFLFSTAAYATDPPPPEWIGMHIDNFVRQYGLPAADYKFASGERTVRMNLGSRTVTVGGAYHRLPDFTSIRDPDFDISLACVVDLTVSKAGKITAVKVVKDTIGFWRLSRCREVFRGERSALPR